MVVGVRLIFGNIPSLSISIPHQAYDICPICEGRIAYSAQPRRAVIYARSSSRDGGEGYAPSLES